MLLRPCALTILLALPLVGMAQNIDEAIEQWLTEGATEAEAAELSDQMMHLRDEPVNLNDTTLLCNLPMLSALQIKGICNYIMLYGQMLSVEELAMVPGFDSTAIATLRPYVVVEPTDERGPFRPWHGKHTIVSGLGGTVEQAEGYANGNYVGDNLRALLCYTYNYRNQLYVRFSADKDPTEAWGKGNYVGYHLMLANTGIIERLIVGRYNLQFGQGLTLWSGMRPFNIVGNSSMRMGSGVRPAGTFYEQGYQQGIAATLRIGGGWRASAFASYVGGTALAGTHVEVRYNNLLAGATVAYTWLKDSIVPRSYLYNATAFAGNRQLVAGIDAMYQWHNITLYAEAATDQGGHAAVVGGATAGVADAGTLGIAYRNISSLYHNLFAQPYSMQSSTGEHGIALDATARLPWQLRALVSADLHNFPTLRYGAYAPSSGRWLRAQIGWQWRGRYSATVRYAHQQKERNVPYSNATAYAIEQTQRNQLQAEARMALGQWQVGARASLASFASQHDTVQRGWLVATNVRYTAHAWQASAGAAWFNVDSYNARLYLSESNLQYAWQMPALTGQGLRLHALLRFDIGTHITLSARYAITYLPGEESIGTGDSRTHGPTRQTWHIQVKLKT